MRPYYVYERADGGAQVCHRDHGTVSKSLAYADAVVLCERLNAEVPR